MAKKAAQASPNQLLRSARLERGWTQKDVADRIGAPLDLNVTRWERGTSRPSAYYVQKLCELFGKSVSELGLLPSQPSSQETSTDTNASQHLVPDSSPLSAPADPKHFWNVPFNRNPFFTGRVEVLQSLHEQLTRNRSVALTQSHALTGLGGIGKTQTAVEYAYRYRDEYRALFWVRAASRETLAADFASLASLLSLPGQASEDQMLIVAAVKRWMSQNTGWLLILDNVDTLSLVADFLPTGDQGHVLLTTRSQATGKIAESLTIEKMDTSESMLLLLRRARILAHDAPLDNVTRTMRIQAQAIVKELDGLPLALEQAGAYIEETSCSLADYIALYKRHRVALLNRSSFTPTDYPFTVANTWALSFQKVEQANPAAAELLRLCAFLHPDAIPEEIITEGASVCGPILGPVAADAFLLNEAIQEVRRFSLMKRDSAAKLLNIHRLVQVVLKDGMNEEEQRQWAERTVRMVNAAFPETSFDNWSRCERCLPHILHCVALIDQYSFTFSEADRLLHHAGDYLCERGRYEQAEPLLRRALALREQLSGPTHPVTAHYLNDLATLYLYDGKYEQAEPLYLRALAIHEQQANPNPPDIAGGYNDLAVLYEYQGKYTQAETLHLRALAMREQELGADHLDVAESLNNLAMIYDFQGKYALSEPLHRRALLIRERELGPNHPRVANGLNNLAWLATTQGQYEQAEPLYQRALAIREQGLGATHPRTAASLDNLAGLYTAQGKYEQAEPLHQRAWTILEQVLGPDHPTTAISLRNLAHVYHLQGDYEQAESLYLRALAVQEQKLGSAHPRLAQTLHYLAQLYEAQARYEQAKQYYQQAITILENTPGPEHPDTLKVREDYGNMLRTMQKIGSL